jgi:ribosomal protection tetracycline resistance protein
VPRGILNLGILAHVDAGKTSLTERLLYSAGVIDEPGSVDQGTTQTDSLALERQRGITIKSAVVSFTVGGTTVNLIDTPGHPDFVAEVERALSVLDGAVLVVSAVEGVQPQTRELTDLLPPAGLPAAGQDGDGPVSGRVFKIERGPAGDKIAYVRMFSGTIAVRDRVRFGRGPGRDGKVTAISVFADGGATRRDAVTAGQIARLSGLAGVQIGDALGTVADDADQHYFAPPTLETAMVALDPRDKPRLYAAITELAEQDPLINVRRGDIRQEIYVSLYGEVQKQVIEATLATEYGIEIGFRETTPICVERPVRSGAAEELLQAAENPFLATLGIRIDPAPAGSGTAFRFEVGHQSVPLFIYKNMEGFVAAMEQYIAETLRQGLYGWQVTDCTVSLIRSAYSVPDGPPSIRGPLSGPQDFRKLTPLVVMAALRSAGTVVCEPVHRFRLETPADTLNVLLPVLARLQAVASVSATNDSWCTVEGDIAGGP